MLVDMQVGGQIRHAAVHVVVTCTNRKTAAIPAKLRLGSLSGQTADDLAQAWIARVANPVEQLLPARDLYAGEHWAIARGLPGSDASHRTQLWVCSAGYGLIPAHALIQPYAVAFSGHEDRVPGGADGARRWWQAIAGWEGPEPGQPRTICALAAANPTASFMLALSAPYLDACQDDINAAAGRLPDLEQLLVISAGTRDPGRLAALMVPADARLQAALGGTRQALNARIAQHLLAVGVIVHSEAARHMADLLATQPQVPRYERQRLSDAEVTQMVAARLAVEPAMTASRMLREFRDGGYACEQQRFAALHRHVAGALR
jgi:hypothetical protein